MPPIRAWNVTRQNVNTLNNALTIVQTIRDEMAKDVAYAGNVVEINRALDILVNTAALVSDHLAAEGK